MLTGRLLSVDSQPLCCLVVLVEVHRTCVSLRRNEEVGPYHAVIDVANADQFGVCGAISVHLLFLAEVNHGAFPEGHAAASASVALEVRVDVEECIHPPVNEALCQRSRG